MVDNCNDGVFYPPPYPHKKNIYPFFLLLLTVFFCCWCELKNLLERYAYSSYVTNSPFGHRLVVRGLPLNLYSLGAPLSPNISIYYLISIKFAG